jgi:hypothetical protein
MRENNGVVPERNPNKRAARNRRLPHKIVVPSGIPPGVPARNRRVVFQISAASCQSFTAGAPSL